MDKDELLWGLYEEHVTQARQHENQRERMTALIVAIAAGVVAFASQTDLARSELLLTVPLILLGIFGAAFSRKHYERNRMHVSIAASYLTRLDPEIYGPRQVGESRHKDDPKYRRSYRWRLHHFWEGLSWAVAILGAVASAVIWSNG